MSDKVFEILNFITTHLSSFTSVFYLLKQMFMLGLWL